MPRMERYKVPGSQIVEKVKELFHQGNVRRICLMDEERPLMEILETRGDPGSPSKVLEIPVLAALGAFSSLVEKCTLEVERTDAAK